MSRSKTAPAQPKEQFRPYTLLKAYHARRCPLCVDGIHRHIFSGNTRLAVCPGAVIEKVKVVVMSDDTIDVALQRLLDTETELARRFLDESDDAA